MQEFSLEEELNFLKFSLIRGGGLFHCLRVKGYFFDQLVLIQLLGQLFLKEKHIR